MKLPRFHLVFGCAALALTLTTSCDFQTKTADTPRDALDRAQKNMEYWEKQKASNPSFLPNYEQAKAMFEEFTLWCNVGSGEQDPDIVFIHGEIEGFTPYNPANPQWIGKDRYNLLEDDRSFAFRDQSPNFAPGTKVYAFGTMWDEDPSVFVVTEDFFKAIPANQFNWLCQANTPENILGASIDELLLLKAKALGIPGPEVAGWKKYLPFIIIAAVVLVILVVVLALVLGGKKSTKPVVVPVNPGIQPVQPVVQSVQPVVEPVQPVDQPVRPVVQPVQPIEPTASNVEHCPSCNSALLPDGTCPKGCTIPRCAECGSIMKNGECPNGCQEAEYCPSCGSKILPDGSCPKGCTIIRCSNCNKILRDGVCPNGCNAEPLHFGWPGAQRPPMTPYALEVVSPAEYAGFRTEIPASFVIGRSAKDAREPFLELLVLDPAKKASCSRRYVELTLDGENGFQVRMLKNHNFAIVRGRKISVEGDTELLAPDSILKLNPDFELKLVRQ